MPYERSDGKQCVVAGCTNSQKKLHCWGQEICEDHDIKHADCSCLVPYKLHCLPKDDQNRRSWLNEINRKVRQIITVMNQKKIRSNDPHVHCNPTKIYIYVHVAPRCPVFVQGNTRNRI